MKECQICGSNIPRQLLVEGKWSNLQHRILCLACSPFKSHNTRTARALSGSPEPPIQCETCGRVYVYNKQKGHSKTRCNSCQVNLGRFEFKLRCIAYKGGKCSLCGYCKCPRSLVFHHTDPEKKDFSVSGSHARSWESIKTELDKCVLLCTNCHGEVHEELERNHKCP